MTIFKLMGAKLEAVEQEIGTIWAGMEELGDSIADQGASESSQLEEEHAAVISQYINESIAFVGQILEAAEQAKAPPDQIEPLKMLITKGEGLLSFVSDITLEEQEEEEEDEDDDRSVH